MIHKERNVVYDWTVLNDLTVNGDFTLTGSFTISGGLNLEGDMAFTSVTAQTFFLGDDDKLLFGNTSASPDVSLYWNTAQTVDALTLGLPAAQNVFIIAERADLAYDFAHGAQTNPTLFIQSAAQSATEFSKLTAGGLSFGLPLAVTATEYSVGRDADATNQLHFNTPTGAGYELSINDIALIRSTAIAPLTITQVAGSSGVPTAFTLTGAAHTGLTAATEDIGVNFNLSATKTWAAGAGPLATQREILIQAPTYAGNAGGALTISDAYTFFISGVPTAGANMTITRPWALGVSGCIDQTAALVGGRTGFNQAFSTSGSSSLTVTGQSLALNAGFTGSGITQVLSFDNALAGTNASYLTDATYGSRLSGNRGAGGYARGVTTGHNVGGLFLANGGTVNWGSWNASTVALTNKSNIGSIGLGFNDAVGGEGVGVYALYANPAAVPNIGADTKTAFLADNAANDVDIAIFRHNGVNMVKVDNNGVLIADSFNPLTAVTQTINSTSYSSADSVIEMATGTATNSSGEFIALELKPTLNQSGTAGSTLFKISATTTAQGSDRQLYAAFADDGNNTFEWDFDTSFTILNNTTTLKMAAMTIAAYAMQDDVAGGTSSIRLPNGGTVTSGAGLAGGSLLAITGAGSDAFAASGLAGGAAGSWRVVLGAVGVGDGAGANGAGGAFVVGGATSYSHYGSTQQTAPTSTLTSTTLNDGGGSGAAFALTAGSTDAAGSFTITAGNGTPVAGIAGQVVFNVEYASIPKAVIVTAKDVDGVNNEIYISSVTTAQFQVSFGTTLAASEAVEFYYWIVQ